MMNCVAVLEAQDDDALVRQALSEVAAAGMPHSLLLRSPADVALRALPPALGMLPHPDLPLMTLSDLSAVERTLAEPAIAVRRLEPAESKLHCAVAAGGFGLPEEIMTTVSGPATLALAGVKAYVGELDGEAATTALAIRRGSHVGIFNVATSSAHRRRGYGVAVTAIAVRDAFADGARCAWLQSSQMGRGVYERLGFCLSESWTLWVSADPAG
jgi:ribosomal protein S18 acetylase RimI-like enzyme